MKKVSARDFQKKFGKIADQLPTGEVVVVTKHGKTVGTFTRTPTVERKVATPDFLVPLQKESCSPDIGDRLLEKFHDSLY